MHEHTPLGDPDEAQPSKARKTEEVVEDVVHASLIERIPVLEHREL